VKLNLKANRLRDEESISRGSKVNKTLAKLSLNYNETSNDGLMFIRPVLQTNKLLVSLKLQISDITSGGVK